MAGHGYLLGRDFSLLGTNGRYVSSRYWNLTARRSQIPGSLGVRRWLRRRLIHHPAR